MLTSPGARGPLAWMKTTSRLGVVLAAVVIAGGCQSKTDSKGSASAAAKSDNSGAISAAKNALASIGRGAVGAYERESVAAEGDGAFSHAQCKSASPIPAKLPKGGETIAVKSADWGGDATTGWKCLKFALDQPVGMQYSYSQGGPYKSKERGGKDPGPDGFEACAEADFNEGGDTTLICQTGAVDPAKRFLKQDTEMQVFEEK